MKRKASLFPVLIWFAALSAIGTLMHIDLIDAHNYPEQLKSHHQIVTHSAPAPYQYRILQPAIVETILTLSKSEVGTHAYRSIFRGSYAISRFLAIFTTFVAIFLSIRLIGSGTGAVFAATTLAAFLPFTYRYYFYQPTSVLEMAFFGLGLLAIITRTPFVLLPLVAVGTLNRETMCFIPFAYFLYWLPKLKGTEWVWLVVSALVWILMFCGLRMLWPATHDLLNIQHYIARNLTLSRGNIDLLVMISPLIIVLFGARQIPTPYLRLALCSVPWLIIHFLTSIWYEIRYYLPMLIWLLPALVFIFSAESATREDFLGAIHKTPPQ